MTVSGHLIRSILSAALLCVCGCACTLFSPEEPSGTSYFDLEQPERIPLPVPVEVAPFSSASNERFRMSFRENAVLFRSSDRNRWAQTPGMLLTKYLRLTFRNGEKDVPADPGRKVHLKGEVLAFNTSGDQAELAVRYTLQYKDRVVGKTVLFREKMKQFTPEGFAHAMSRAAFRLAQLVRKESTLLAGGKI